MSSTTTSTLSRHAARVVTVHDLTCVHFPELCTPHTRRYPALIARAVRDGAFVHTVSNFVRDEVIEYFDVPPERVVAIANGVDPEIYDRVVDLRAIAAGNGFSR